MLYDNNGNQYLGFGGLEMGYDAANRMASATTGTQSSYYTYDTSNMRVYARNNTGAETVYFYGVDGKKLATYTIGFTQVTGGYSMQLNYQSSNVYFAGRLVSAEGNVVSTDRLASVRNGGLGNLGYQAQYPYGAEYTPTTVNDREKYATYTRDSLTGLDYAVNRYYSSLWGRFTSPDPYAGSISLGNPQSWNRYAYEVDDPANGNDPSGPDPYCGSTMIWDGEGCTYGTGGLPPASLSSAVNLYSITTSQGQQVNTGSMNGSFSSDLTNAYNQYASNFGYQVQGTLFGVNYSQFFSSFDAYANWATSLAVQPQNQVYAAFAALAQYLVGFDPSQTYTVSFVIRGSTYNVQVAGADGQMLTLNLNEVVPNAGNTGFGHGENDSWYIGGWFEVLHLVDVVSSYGGASPGGAEGHIDAFSPFGIGLPMHGIEWGLSRIISNQKGSFQCSLSAGCN